MTARFFLGSRSSLVAMSQSTHRAGSRRGSVHLPNLFATMAYLVQGRFAVNALRIHLRHGHPLRACIHNRMLSSPQIRCVAAKVSW